MSLKGKRIFITGGLGFIGSYLVERLLAHNEVTVFDNFFRNSLEQTAIYNRPNLNLVKGDILDAKKLKRSARGHDVIMHLAAMAGVDNVIANPVKTFNVNFGGTYNLLEAASSMGVDRFVYFSTSEVYGAYANNVSEESPTIQGDVHEPRWVYAVTKLLGDNLGFAYHKETGLPFVSIRPFNIYGPRQVSKGAMYKFVHSAIHNEPLVIHNKGDQVRAWCYVDDIADAVVMAAEKKSAVGEAFNIGNPRTACTVKQLARKIISIAGSRSTLKYRKIDYAEVYERSPQIGKAQKLLGYSPKVGLDEGLARTIDWYRSKQK